MHSSASLPGSVPILLRPFKHAPLTRLCWCLSKCLPHIARSIICHTTPPFSLVSAARIGPLPTFCAPADLCAAYHLMADEVGRDTCHFKLDRRGAAGCGLLDDPSQLMCMHALTSSYLLQELTKRVEIARRLSRTFSAHGEEVRETLTAIVGQRLTHADGDGLNAAVALF